MPQYTLKILRDTILKQKPIQSTQLADSEKYPVKAGTTLVLRAYLQMGNHLKFTLNEQNIQGFNTWYAYIPDIQLLKDGQALNSLEHPVQRQHGTSEPNKKPLVRWIASPNFSYRNGVPIRRIVLHSTATPSIAGVINWFQNPASQVSAHYIIDRNGELYQMVRDADKAWHAYGANSDTIGIEHVATANQPLTPEQEKASIALIKWLQSEYKIAVEEVVGHRFASSDPSLTTCPNYLFGKPTEQALKSWVNQNLA